MTTGERTCRTAAGTSARPQDRGPFDCRSEHGEVPLIRREPGSDGKVRLTFELPAELMLGAVSVVGDFNDWRPGVTPFGGRGSVRSATVEVDRGRRYAFRYLADGGRWFDDDDSDGVERNADGITNCVVDLTSE